MSFDKPVRHMREYLSILRPLIHERSASFEGETLGAQVGLDIPGAEPCPILVAALGPQMLQLAGRLADGTITWMTGPNTLSDHIVPTISASAAEHGRAAPRVIAGVPICVTDDVDASRERVGQALVTYGFLPSYRAMLDREGLGGPGDFALLGDEATVAAGLATYDRRRRRRPARRRRVRQPRRAEAHPRAAALPPVGPCRRRSCRRSTRAVGPTPRRWPPTPTPSTCSTPRRSATATRCGRGSRRGRHRTDWSDDGFTALHYAGFFGTPDAVAALIAAGADLDVASRNDMGVRPINSAAAGPHAVESVRLLLAAGADVDGRQASGHTALDEAVIRNDDELAALLRAHGATEAAEAISESIASRYAWSAGDPAAVDGEDLAGDVAAGVAGEEQQGAVELVLLRRPAPSGRCGS